MNNNSLTSSQQKLATSPKLFDHYSLGASSGPYCYSTSNEGDYFSFLLLEKYFSNCNIAQAELKFVSDKSSAEIMNIISKELNVKLIENKIMNSFLGLVFEDGKGSFFFLRVYISTHHEFGNKESDLYFILYAPIENIAEIDSKLKNLVFVEKALSPIINWVTINNSGNIVKNLLKISENKGVKDYFYPSIKQGVNKYYKEYEDSQSPILIILGPPGTGKTSFIRNYTYQHNKKVTVSYDINLMMLDEFFLSFLQGNQDLLILEDYDEFLRKRIDESETRIMSKFLNLSQGLVQIGTKKIIFTANCEKSVIDTALIRPGRCFDVLEFNRYTEKEAVKFIKEENLTYNHNPDNTTMAELFLNKKSEEVKFGFL